MSFMYQTVQSFITRLDGALSGGLYKCKKTKFKKKVMSNAVTHLKRPKFAVQLAP